MKKTAIAAIVTACFASWAIAAPKESPPQTPPRVPSPEEWAFIEQVRQDFPPGTTLRWWWESDGTLKVKKDADVTGPNARLRGTDVKDESVFGATGLMIDDDSATSDESRRNASAKFSVNVNAAIRTSSLWIGVVLILGAGACIYLQKRRAATVVGCLGGVFIVAAFFPTLAATIIGGGVALVAGPYVWAEFKKAQAEDEAAKNKKTLRAVIAGVEAAPADAKAAIKAEVVKKADQADKETIARVKFEDKIK